MQTASTFWQSAGCLTVSKIVSETGRVVIEKSFQDNDSFNFKYGLLWLTRHLLLDTTVFLNFIIVAKKTNSINKKLYFILWRQVLVNALLPRMQSRFKARAGRAHDRRFQQVRLDVRAISSRTLFCFLFGLEILYWQKFLS